MELPYLYCFYWKFILHYFLQLQFRPDQDLYKIIDDFDEIRTEIRPFFVLREYLRSTYVLEVFIAYLPVDNPSSDNSARPLERQTTGWKLMPKWRRILHHQNKGAQLTTTTTTTTIMMIAIFVHPMMIPLRHPMMMLRTNRADVRATAIIESNSQDGLKLTPPFCQRCMLLLRIHLRR